MQKFTRALTREIEVGGERLAVTLTAEGISIRPVGSRKPPHKLSWDAILCVMNGHLPPQGIATREEVTEALIALRGGKASSPGKARREAKEEPLTDAPAERLLDSAAPDLKTMLDALEGWLRQHRPRYLMGLFPPASDEELEALSQVLARPLPDELRLWLQWHNGEREEFIGAFYEAFHLMSAAQIAAAWQDRCSNQQLPWDPVWIPLLEDYQDNLLVLNPQQPGCAVLELWRGREEPVYAAGSLALWVEDLVREVERGGFVEDPERGEFRHVGR